MTCCLISSVSSTLLLYLHANGLQAKKALRLLPSIRTGKDREGNKTKQQLMKQSLNASGNGNFLLSVKLANSVSSIDGGIAKATASLKMNLRPMYLLEIVFKHDLVEIDPR